MTEADRAGPPRAHPEPPVTREEIDTAKARALCEAATEAAAKLKSFLDEHGYPDKDSQWELREVGNELARAHMAARTVFEEGARTLLPAALDEIERLRETVARERERCAELAETQCYYPDTHTGTRQEWVKRQIADKIRNSQPDLPQHVRSAER